MSKLNYLSLRITESPRPSPQQRPSTPPPAPRLATVRALPTADASMLRRAKDQGSALLAEGKLEAALAAFQEVAKAAPGEPLNHQKVAEVLQRLGCTSEAVEAYEAAAELWARTGWLLRAIALCKVILQLDPGHTRTQALLATLHTRREHSRANAQRHPPVPPGLLRRRPPLFPMAASSEEQMSPIPFFSSLGREVFLEVLAGVERRVCRPGDVIVQEGSPGTSMFIIVEGEVKVERQGRGSQPLTLAKMGEGEFFGEMALLYEGTRLSSVVATSECVLLEFPRKRMEEISVRFPQLNEVVQRLYRQRLLANALRSNPLFAGWPEDLQQAVSEAFSPVSVAEGEEILTRGKPAPALYLVLRGRCIAFHQHVDGRETPYPEMAEGDIFGEISLFRSKLATASVRATTPCVLLKLDQHSLERLLPHHPLLQQELQRLGAERMLRTTMLLCGRPIHLGDTRV
jgi:cAMP-dependent protein kinase regulator